MVKYFIVPKLFCTKKCFHCSSSILFVSVPNNKVFFWFIYLYYVVASRLRVYQFSVLPLPPLTCCEKLPTSFGSNGPHFRRWLVGESSSDIPSKVFRGFPQPQGKCQEAYTQQPVSSPYHTYQTDVTNVTLE